MSPLACEIWEKVAQYLFKFNFGEVIELFNTLLIPVLLCVSDILFV